MARRDSLTFQLNSPAWLIIENYSMRSIAALYLDSQRDLSPDAQAFEPSSRSATASAFCSPVALMVFQCLISSRHFPLSVWSASAEPQATSVRSAIAGIKCFMRLFTKLPNQFTKPGRHMVNLCYNTLKQIGRTF